MTGEMPQQQRFADLVRLHLSGRRALSLDDEKALLSAAVADLSLELAEARGILLRLAASGRVRVESVERERLARALCDSAHGGKLSSEALQEGAALARSWAVANGGGRAEALTLARDVAEREALTPAWRWWWLGPQRWYEADPAFAAQPDVRTAPWWVAR